MRTVVGQGLALLAALAAVSCRAGYQSPPGGSPAVDCDALAPSFTWSENGHCYSRSDLPLPRAAAEASCEGAGGTLAVPTSAEENAALVAGLAPAVPVWIGVSAPDAIWTTVTGEPTLFAAWAPGEPTASYRVGAAVRPDGTWEARTDTALGFVCEVGGWQANPAGDHDYRLLYGLVTWSAAVGRCEAAGGHLATITSLDEQAFVAGLALTKVWLGAHEVDAVGTWEWTTGEPFAFAAWGSGQPDLPASPANCLSLNPGGGWVDDLCGGAYAALCERD